MEHKIRELIEQRELSYLAPYAAKAVESRGRLVPEEPDPIRTCYQRDRDRILHSKPFRRLKHKTQVFIEPVGDHYRTRLTHSLEVAQIARTISRALRLNEDLTEAIALAHDVGHTPFGHTGEEGLSEALAEYRQSLADRGEPLEGVPTHFRHEQQSLRIVDHIARLNLTMETRAGISGHSKGRKDLTPEDGGNTSTLEAAVVRISDRIAYLAHDLDDALRSGIVSAAPDRFRVLGDSSGARIGTMVGDVIRCSLDQPAIRLSEGMLAVMNDLKEWLYTNVYERYPVLFPDIGRARNLVKELFFHFARPENSVPGFEGVQGAVDYVAGMTDRFAMETYVKLKLPRGFREDAVANVP